MCTSVIASLCVVTWLCVYTRVAACGEFQSNVLGLQEKLLFCIWGREIILDTSHSVVPKNNVAFAVDEMAAPDAP